MFDKNWFYYTIKNSDNKYKLDIWLSTNLTIKNNEYIIFHKRHFQKILGNELQNSMQILAESKDIDNFQLDENYFRYALTYYQRQKNKAYIKNAKLEEKEVYEDLFNSFWLELRFIEYLEVLGNYEDIDDIKDNFNIANIEQWLSFLLWIATIYWDWNLIEQDDDVFLWNIIIRIPFDWRLADYQDIIIKLEDLLIENHFYNNIHFTKKQDFIINIIDKDILNLFGKEISKWKLSVFFQTQEPIQCFFDENLEKFKKQLDQDLRIKLNNFKLTEIKWISLDF